METVNIHFWVGFANRVQLCIRGKQGKSRIIAAYTIQFGHTQKKLEMFSVPCVVEPGHYPLMFEYRQIEHQGGVSCCEPCVIGRRRRSHLSMGSR